ncbi:MAG: aminotransferase class III-fold pyridoxal phosphate-dependent enzyme [Candidatus Nealsonbacteria bacterium]
MKKRNSPKSNLFHRRLNYQYPLITRGKGIYLYDKTGKRYIDGTGGALVANLGHGVKEIAQAAQKLAARFSYLHGSQFSTEDLELYAKELCAVAPKGLDRVFFISGGSEAVESAIKLAKQYHYDSGDKKRYKIISRYPAYHGATILTVSISTKPSMREPQGPLIFKMPVVPAPFCYRCPFGKSYPECGLACAWALEETIKKEGPETISTFIAEPVIGASAGAVVPPKEYFPIIRKICDKYGVILILDEVMAGFGRTGKWFASQHFNVLPDITVVGKGIGGGLVPLAAVFCREKILKAIQNGSGNFIHGFTFENNPFTAGIGRETLKYMKKHNLVQASSEKGKYLLKKLETLKKLEIVGDARGIGLMTAIELVQDKTTKKPFPRNKQMAEIVLQTAMKKGLNLYFAIGFTKEGEGDAVMIAPPFIVTKKEIDEIVEILKDSILEVQKSI